MNKLNFNQRSYKKEILDEDNIPFEDIRRNMQELNTINHLLGGHSITLKGIERIIDKKVSKSKEWQVVEIGCGGGDNLRVVKNWAQKRGINIQLTGVDINPACIQFAKSTAANSGIDFICSDYKNVTFTKKPHIIFSSLFCHHFTEEELVQMLQWKVQNCTHGFFINDLQRHPLAYYSIKILTALFSKSYLVKNDAPLSVLRGFSKKEWLQLFNKAAIKHFQCNWQWAFRWLVTYTH